MSWQMSTLGEIAKVGAGNSAPQGDHFFSPDGVPFFRTSDVGRIRFGQVSDSADRLNETGSRGLRLLPKGAILLPKSGASTFLNHRVMLDVDGFVSSHLATIVADESRVLAKYLLYFLATVKAQNLVQDHAYPSLNLPVISGIGVPLPSIPEQQRIVAILDEAFSGIATAKANAEKSRQFARELFKKQLHDIFSDSKVVRKPISQICTEIFAGGDVPKHNYSKVVSDRHSIPIYTNGEKNKGLYGFTEKPRVTSPSLTISARGTIGYTEIRHESYFPAIRLIVVIPDTQIVFLKYVYYSLEAIDFKHTGTSIPQLTVPMVREFLVALPSLAEQSAIIERLDALWEELSQLESIYTRKLAALEALKQSLLHQAFSGQL